MLVFFFGKRREFFLVMFLFDFKVDFSLGRKCMIRLVGWIFFFFWENFFIGLVKVIWVGG